MFISQLNVHHFRSLVGVDLELRPLTAVIGPNGSGKSALLDALVLLQCAAAGELSDFFTDRGGFEAVLSLANGDAKPRDLDVAIRLQDGQSESPKASKYSYSIGMQSTAFGYEVAREELTFSAAPNRSGKVFEYDLTAATNTARRKAVLSGLGIEEIRFSEAVVSQLRGDHRERFRVLSAFRKHLSGIRFYAPVDVSTRSPVRLPQTLTPTLNPGENGETLYSALYNLRANHPDLYDQVLVILTQAFPGLHRLEFPVVGAGQVTLSWHDRNTRQPFYPNQLSEGTLRFLWLTTLLKTAEAPDTLVIDEPELSLHPQLLRLLAIMLQEAAMTTQAIVATHSSELINWLAPEEVLIADKEDGQSHFTWANTFNLEKWLATYNLRDLWLMGNLGGRN